MHSAYQQLCARHTGVFSPRCSAYTTSESRNVPPKEFQAHSKHTARNIKLIFKGILFNFQNLVNKCTLWTTWIKSVPIWRRIWPICMRCIHIHDMVMMCHHPWNMKRQHKILNSTQRRWTLLHFPRHFFPSNMIVFMKRIQIWYTFPCDKRPNNKRTHK